jgi:hypothetical protein
MTWRPTGSPSERPQGTLRPGSPAMFTGSVQASFRYISSGSSVLAPILKATLGEVGAINASTSARSASNSALIRVRTCWALT